MTFGVYQNCFFSSRSYCKATLPFRLKVLVWSFELFMMLLVIIITSVTLKTTAKLTFSLRNYMKQSQISNLFNEIFVRKTFWRFIYFSWTFWLIFIIRLLFYWIVLNGKTVIGYRFPINIPTKNVLSLIFFSKTDGQKFRPLLNLKKIYYIIYIMYIHIVKKCLIISEVVLSKIHPLIYLFVSICLFSKENSPQGKVKSFIRLTAININNWLI